MCKDDDEFPYVSHVPCVIMRPTKNIVWNRHGEVYPVRSRMEGKKMFQIFREEIVISAIMFSLLGFSLAVRIALGILYDNMIRETDNMAVTQNAMLKLCKLRFTNCYQMNNGVNNIPIFVDRFLTRMSIGPFTYEKLYHFSGQTMLLCVVTNGIGICKCIMDGKTLGQILPFYIACFGGLYLYCCVSTAVDLKGKRRTLKVNLVDYLENHLSVRIGVTGKDLEMLGGVSVPQKGIELVPLREKRRLDSAEGLKTDCEPAALATAGADQEKPVTEEELEALLKEFLAI